MAEKDKVKVSGHVQDHSVKGQITLGLRHVPICHNCGKISKPDVKFAYIQMEETAEHVEEEKTWRFLRSITVSFYCNDCIRKELDKMDEMGPVTPDQLEKDITKKVN